MMTAELILILISAIAIILKGVAVLNKMNHTTCHCMRVMWILLTSAAGATLLFDICPTWPQAAFYVVVAGMVLCDRRAKVCDRRQ